jgi:hypothetical protein
MVSASSSVAYRHASGSDYPDLGCVEKRFVSYYKSEIKVLELKSLRKVGGLLVALTVGAFVASSYCNAKFNKSLKSQFFLLETKLFYCLLDLNLNGFSFGRADSRHQRLLCHGSKHYIAG